jgi:TP901 family phage tail tape measure protein
MSEKGASWVVKLIDMVSGPLSKISSMAGATINKFESMTATLSNIGRSALFLTSLSTAITSTSDALNIAVEPGVRFETQIKDLQSITGQTGKNLDYITESARKNAMQFGGNAADQVESYKIILSKLGPDIANVPEALDGMGKSVQLLSKTMGNDAVGAVDALTTAMNQYNVDLSDPMQASRSMARMMDIMTAGAKVGAAEVDQIAASIKVAGLSAKNAGLSFEETNAAIQVLAKGSVTGAEAGTALRNVMALMSRGDFIPKAAQEGLKAYGVDIAKIADESIPFADRLKEMSKIQGDSALVTKTFGMENKNAAMLLMQNTDLIKDWTKEVGQSGVTLEMANTVMGSYQERMNRVKADFADFGISVFNATKPMLPFIQTGVMIIAFSAQLVPGLAVMGKGLVSVGSGFKFAALSAWGFVKSLAVSGYTALVSAGQYIFMAVAGLGSLIAPLVVATFSMWGLNAAMFANPVGAFVLGIMAIIAAVALVITYWDEIWNFLIEFGEYFAMTNPFYWIIELVEYVFPGFKKSVVEVFTQVWQYVKKFWDMIVGVWNRISGMFGGTAVSLTANDVTMGTEMVFDDKGRQRVNKADDKKSTEVEGDSSKSRIVNMRIDKIEINAPVSNSGFPIENLGDEIARVIVGGIRDAEVILSNG